MNRSMSRLWLLLPLLPALLAQQPATNPEPVPDAATLQRQFDEAQREWTKANTEAARAKDEAALARLRAQRPEAQFTPLFQRGARLGAGTEAAVPYLVWLVSRGTSDDAKAAMTTLMEHHVASPGIRLAVARIGGLKERFGAEQCRTWLDRVLVQNEDPSVCAQTLFTRAAMYVGTRAVTTSEELRQQSIADLERALRLLDRGGDQASLRGLCTDLLDEGRRLEPGLVAPDINGKDLDGVPFKLSDYRGKVVLLDFWGDW